MPLKRPMPSLWTPFKKLLIIYLGLVTIFFLGRLGLFIFYFDRIIHSNTEYWWSFLYGLRMDTMVASLFLLIPAILLLLLPSTLKTLGNISLRLYLLFIFLLVIYIENATFPFFAEFDVRPNALFINYIEYPKEVLGNIWASYKLEIFISSVMLLVFTLWFWRKSKNFFIETYDLPYLKRVLLFFPLFILLFIGVRSSFQHRPANISDATYTKSHLVNEITKNSLYAIGYAYYSQKTGSVDMKRYGKMPIEEAYQRMGKRLDIDPKRCKTPFARIVSSAFKRNKPKNLVIFIQESLGAQFVGALGDKRGITPNLDQLSEQGLWFEQLYSNGTRSIRGLAGLSAGFLPVPGKGVLKRNKAQQGFFTVAQLLKPYGYHSLFLYGGEKRFDNMASWYYGNGFDNIIDEKKFINPTFHGIWGVSDEDLVKRANLEFKSFHDKQQPFVSVMFSTTNHTPFEFPEGRIEPVEGVKKNSVENAIKYADYAIGLFMTAAKKEAYYNDTIFLIASDHNVRVYGDNLLPFEMFKIMGVILGDGVERKKINRLTMQPDLLATALDLIGIDNLRYPILGHSIYQDHKKDISLMQFHQMYGLRVGNEIAIIQPEEDPITMRISNGKLVETTHNIELEKDTLGFIIGINALYQQKKFRPISPEDCTLSLPSLK
jgi:phosphoglycerol transferase MdoB-like AlkP superfamily enzyme